jgi:hypothetical protein
VSFDNFKKAVLEEDVKVLFAKLRDKFPKRPRRTAWERINRGFMEGRWEQLRSWWGRQ